MRRYFLRSSYELLISHLSLNLNQKPLVILSVAKASVLRRSTNTKGLSIRHQEARSTTPVIPDTDRNLSISS